MAFELKQQLKLSQKLLMTPQLQQAIKLLQLSRHELVELVKDELQSNPVLEDAGSAETAGEGQLESAVEQPPTQEIEWQTYLQHYDDQRPGGLDFSTSKEDSFVEKARDSSFGTLKDHLLWQLRLSGFSESVLEVGEFIIGHIDEDGYLRVINRDGMEDSAYVETTTMELSNLTGVSQKEVESVLKIVHSFDPCGAGARTTAECLLLQARNLPVRDTVVEDIIMSHLPLVASRNYKAISKLLLVPVEKIVEAVEIITSALSPMPGRGYGVDESRVIIPDVYVQKIDGKYTVMSNDDGMPRLRVSSYYRKMLSEKDSDAKGYIQERMRAAMWLIKSVHQRQRTLSRVMESIVKFQYSFLDKGIKHLKPLVLKDVAEDIEVHESTVSRVTSGKYVHTPRGIFELKYFFTSAITGSTGQDVPVEYIKEKIKEVIESEDQGHPFSDKSIVELLNKSGIVLARRTVAKYREELGFLSSSKRCVRF